MPCCGRRCAARIRFVCSTARVARALQPMKNPARDRYRSVVRLLHRALSAQKIFARGPSVYTAQLPPLINRCIRILEIRPNRGGARYEKCITHPRTAILCPINVLTVAEERSVLRTTHERHSRQATPSSAKLVGLGRVELPTSPLSGVRSNQLSYRP